jgi:hypothetical protein
MNPAAPAVLGWLVRDTFRQAQCSGVFALVLAVTLLCVLFCLTATVQPAADGLDLAFGAVAVSTGGGLDAAVRSLEANLAGWVGDVIGLALALVWTAGFLPAFLEPGAVVVLLAKPVPRWSLLAGKVLGVLAFVALQFAVFLLGTWLALGLRTGVWDPAYLWCLPLLVLHFAVFFSFSAMLAVATRSTVACLFGSVLFWILCWGMNLGRHVALLWPDLDALSPAFAHAVEGGYWLLPKPLDFHLLLLDGLQGDHPLRRLVDTQALAARGAWSPAASLLASAACGVVLLVLAACDFLTAEY